MSLLNFFRKPASVPIELLEVRDRARLIHERLGHRQVAITDFFAMVGEDESIVRRREIRQAQPPETNIRRFLPADVPSNDRPRFLPGDIPTTGDTMNWQD